MATTPNDKNWRFPDYTDSPDIPRDISLLAKDISDYIDAHPGPAGPQGDRGYSVLNGTSDPSSGIGVNGDFYINTTSNSIFGPKTSGAWGSGTGLGGNSVLNGTADPTSLNGSDGDFYINTISNEIFGPKANGSWPSGISLVGPTGAQGQTGATGPKGDAAATVSVDPNTVTGLPGSSASVVNLGTSSDAIFKFTIPRGADGAQGPEGPAGASANLDPIDSKISLPLPTTSGLGVSSNWFPSTILPTHYLGQAADPGTGAQARSWKGAYLQTSPTITSDLKLKENISDSDLGLNFINDLRPVSYQLKGNVSGRYHYGLIAQEVKTAIDASGVEDFGGWVKEDLNDPDSAEYLRYEELIAPLIKAVQELTARVKALEEK